MHCNWRGSSDYMIILKLDDKSAQKWAKLNFTYRDKNLWFNRRKKYSDLEYYNSCFLRGSRSGIKLTLHNFSNSLLKRRCPWRQVSLYGVWCVNFQNVLEKPCYNHKSHYCRKWVGWHCQWPRMYWWWWSRRSRWTNERFLTDFQVRRRKKKRNFRTIQIDVLLLNSCTEERQHQFWLRLLLEKQF